MATKRKAKGTATPAKVAAQKEGLSHMAKGATVDAADILKELETKEREAFAEFEAKQKEAREKALAAVIDPLRKERGEAVEAWNEAGQRIKDIDAAIAKLLGRKVTHGAAPEKGGKRNRLSEAQQIEAADAIVKIVYAAGDDGVSKGQLQEQVSPFPSKTGAALKELVNAKTTTGKKITIKGDKAAAKYVAA